MDEETEKQYYRLVWSKYIHHLTPFEMLEEHCLRKTNLIHPKWEIQMYRKIFFVANTRDCLAFDPSVGIIDALIVLRCRPDQGGTYDALNRKLKKMKKNIGCFKSFKGMGISITLCYESTSDRERSLPNSEHKNLFVQRMHALYVSLMTNSEVNEIFWRKLND